MPKSNSSKPSLYEELLSEAHRDDAAEAVSSDLLGLPGIGPKTLSRFEEAGIHSIADLVRILPSRYEDRRQLTPLESAEVGQRVVVAGEVASVRLFGPRWRKMLEVRIDANGHSLYGMWFSNRRPKPERFPKGAQVAFAGLVSTTKTGRLRIAHPTVIDLDRTDGSSDGLSIVPIYPRLPEIPGATLAKALSQALDDIDLHVREYLPSDMTEAAGVMPLTPALLAAHRPGSESVDFESLNQGDSQAAARLLFDELFFLQLVLGLRRESVSRQRAPKVDHSSSLFDEMSTLTGLRPTSAQTRTLTDILEGLSRPYPMRRLLQGDVGSGKTWVAAGALLALARAGFQGAMMVPTTVLASQQHGVLEKVFKSIGLRVALLTSNDTGGRRAAVLKEVAAGTIDLVVGTHALLQSDVRFARLGLVVVDEQHRFGVHQRAALAQGNSSGEAPHYLVMTATPIPRSLALTVYGDLDLSVLDELPPGRSPISTELSFNSVRKADRAIGLALGRSEQCYYICPAIDESEALNSTGVEKAAVRLRKKHPGAQVETLHGRMSQDVKDRILERFATGEVDILAATTVVEVGVDVPGATLMVIDGADRFGLATLHQLRGRVGRGTLPSSCHLIARSDGQQAHERLEALAENTDGFALAEIDLNLRGPGDLLGAAQSGLLALGRARLPRDLPILETARLAARRLLGEHPCLSDATLHPLRKELARRLALLHTLEP